MPLILQSTNVVLPTTFNVDKYVEALLNVETPLIINDDIHVAALLNVDTPLIFNDDKWVEALLNVDTPLIFNDDIHVAALFDFDIQLTFKLLIFNVDGFVKLLIDVNNVVLVACKFDILLFRSINLICVWKIDESLKNHILWSIQTIVNTCR